MSDDEDAALAHVDRTRLTVVAGPIVGPVLSRVVGMLAARAALPLDKVNDALLIADAIAAHAPAFAPDARLSVSIQSQPGRLELRVGPLRSGAGRKLLESASLPAVGDLFGRLADAVRVRDAGAGGDYVHLRIDAQA